MDLQASSQNERVYGDTIINDNARVHNGDNIGTHNHHYHVYAGPRVMDQNAQIDKELFESLTFDRMNARAQNVTAHLPHTCEWFLQHEKFRKWCVATSDRDMAQRFLWVKGKPGCGKSTIMKNTLVWTYANLPDTIVVNYFFNARAPGLLEKSAIGLYRSLSYQLLSQIPHLKRTFSSTFGNKHREGKVDDWTEPELQNFLVNILSDTKRPRLAILIDALDEGQETDVRYLVEFLEMLIMTPSSAGRELLICMSSRHYPHITAQNSSSLIIEGQEGHTHDLRTYISKKLFVPEEDSSSRLASLVHRKSQGVFLWIVLVVRILNRSSDRGADLPTLIAQLEELPSELNHLFSEILSRTQDNISDCVSLLQWALFARRAMSAEELYLGMQHSNGISSPRAPRNKSRLDMLILDRSRGLLEQVAGRRSNYVQFIHESVREYLLGEGGLATLQPRLASNPTGFSHVTLMLGCFYHLVPLLPQADRHSSLGNFSEYCILYLEDHLDRADACGVAQEAYLPMILEGLYGDSLEECKEKLRLKGTVYCRTLLSLTLKPGQYGLLQS